MADTHRIVRSLLTVFLDLSGSPTFVFANLKPIALAQSYTFDIVKATQSLVANDLADPTGAAAWASPEPTEKSWTATTDALVLIEDSANPNYDPALKSIGSEILTAFKDDVLVWVALLDSDAATGDTIPLFGQAIVTGFSQSGTIDEYHTYTTTFTGEGEIGDSFTIT